MIDIQKSFILVCVPSEAVEEISCSLFSDPRFNIEVVKTSDECLEKIHSDKFDTLIIDICFLKIHDKLNIPLLHELTALLPVIITGGNNNSEIENKIREEKIFYYLVKPIEQKELIKVVEEAIKWSRRNK